MTIEIDKERKGRALNPPAEAGAHAVDSRGRLITGIWTGIGVAVAGGLALTGMVLVTTDKPAPYLAYSIVCYMAAAVGLGLIGVDRLLAEREEFYRRGQLEGWMRGWRGQEPEADDPLRRR